MSARRSSVTVQLWWELWGFWVILRGVRGPYPVGAGWVAAVSWCLLPLYYFVWRPRSGRGGLWSVLPDYPVFAAGWGGVGCRRPACLFLWAVAGVPASYILSMFSFLIWHVADQYSPDSGQAISRVKAAGAVKISVNSVIFTLMERVQAYVNRHGHHGTWTRGSRVSWLALA